VTVPFILGYGGKFYVYWIEGNKKVACEISMVGQGLYFAQEDGIVVSGVVF
jgi:hypothetical protein